MRLLNLLVLSVVLFLFLVMESDGQRRGGFELHVGKQCREDSECRGYCVDSKERAFCPEVEDKCYGRYCGCHCIWKRRLTIIPPHF